MPTQTNGRLDELLTSGARPRLVRRAADEFAEYQFVSATGSEYQVSCHHYGDGEWSLLFRLMHEPDLDRALGDAGVGDASSVFSSVIAATKDLMRRERVRRLVFSSPTAKRASLYARIIRRALPNARVATDPSFTYGVRFLVEVPDTAAVRRRVRERVQAASPPRYRLDERRKG